MITLGAAIDEQTLTPWYARPGFFIPVAIAIFGGAAFVYIYR